MLPERLDPLLDLQSVLPGSCKLLLMHLVRTFCCYCLREQANDDVVVGSNYLKRTKMG